MRRILWFRRDLRTEDNLLLGLEGEVLPIFIFDKNILGPLPRDDRRVSFLFEQAVRLKREMQQQGLDLALFAGTPEEVFAHLLEAFRPDEVCASGDYDAYAHARDRRISLMLPFRFLHDTYVFRPDEVTKNDGTPYLVFTPFYKRAKALFGPHQLREAPKAEQRLADYDYAMLRHLHEGKEGKRPVSLEVIGFKAVPHNIEPVEALLQAFAPKLAAYEKARDLLDQDAASGLGPHLRFGTLGIRALLRWLAERKEEGAKTEPFLRQLLFRDFYASLLYHFPRLAWENFRYAFTGIADERRYEAFVTARTGVPLVDAAVTQLLQTGRMHNRARMVCASFFTKDLLLPWQQGEAFFARHLLDYDAASNILSWQWSAGTGVDPQPYFRIFNPYLQARKFDKEARYIKRWLPQLRSVEPHRLHDEAWLEKQSIEGYPRPIVSHQEAAQKALAYFKEHL
jgi:deoxyribodipyrimidine photo-lyase